MMSNLLKNKNLRVSKNIEDRRKWTKLQQRAQAKKDYALRSMGDAVRDLKDDLLKGTDRVKAYKRKPGTKVKGSLLNKKDKNGTKR